MNDSIALQQPETARLRARNQLTLPERVVSRLDVKPGDRFLIVVDGPDSVRMVRIRDSYAGALSGLWGSTQTQGDDWLRNERESWQDREELYDPQDAAAQP